MGMEKNICREVDKKTSREVDKKPSREVDKKPSREVDKKPSREVDKKTAVKDRGDLKKNNSKPYNADTELYNELKRELKEFLPDHGDSRLSNQKPISKPVEKKKSEDAKKNNDTSKKDLTKKVESVPNRTYLDLEGRKRLRERYTLRLKNSLNLSKNSDVKAEIKENIKSEKKLDEELPAKDKSNGSSRDSVYMNSRPDKKPVKEAPCQRKPIIKTVTVKNDSRVYKAVTFVDQKQNTPLQIKMPNTHKKKAKEVYLKLSKESIKEKEKPVKKVKKRSRKKRVLSPEFQKGNASPPTEVAKWAPSCMNHHTKPYYEAWVDTTLAAISKCSKKDKLFLEKQNVIKTFQRALMERPHTPDLVYEKFNDERYTGRIKVRQRKIVNK